VLTFSRIKQIIGEKQFSIDAKNVEDLVYKLIAIHGISLKQEIFDGDGKIKKKYRILVNGRNINLLDGFQTKLNKDDMVVLMPAVAGG
jgi:MoaD family protein